MGASLVHVFKRLSHSVLAVAACALVGCAAEGIMPPPGAEASAAPPPQGPVRPAPGKALVKLNRIQEVLYAGAPATVKINGNQVASLWQGQSTGIEVAPGATSITVDAWSYPGAYTVNLDAKAGSIYAFDIRPRQGSVAPGMILGPLAGLMDQGEEGKAGAFEILPATAPPIPPPTPASPKKR
jgi:hypothetical protein